MGKQTTLRPNMTRQFDSRMKSRSTIKLRFDVPLLLVTITLLVIGGIMVFSASWDFSQAVYESSSYIFIRQLQLIGLSLVAMVGLSLFDYRKYEPFALVPIIISIGLLAGVAIFGDVRHGAARAIFEGSYQPSELAKLATIYYLSVWLVAKKDVLNKITFGLIPLMVILGFVSGLIYLQPDISAMMTVILIGGVMFFLANVDIRQILVLTGGAGGIGFIVARFIPTGVNRVNEYILGLENITNSSYHVRRSIEAFVTGGWFGVGIGRGDTKMTGLPFPHTDSIFAVIGEEAGLLGAALVVILFTLLLWRGLMIAKNAPDEQGKLLAAGITLWIVFEAFVNMAGMIGLLPFAGNTLPMISAGGSNLLMTLAGIGLLFNISRLSSETEHEAQWRPFGEVVSMRRRNRRGRVSRTRRATRSNS